MSTSRCGKICITPPKCKRKERGRNFYSRCSIVAAAGAMSWRCFVFCCESKSTLFGLPNEYTTRNQWLSCIYNIVPVQYNTNIRVCAAQFTEDCFLILGESSLQCEHYEHYKVGQFQHRKDSRVLVCRFYDHKCRHGDVYTAQRIKRLYESL